MVSYICVGCGRNVAIDVQKNILSLGYSKTMYWVCPDCDQNSNTKLVQNNGKYDAYTSPRLILGRYFDTLALCLCIHCGELYTVDTQDHGLRDASILPRKTYAIRCPKCYGKGKFFIEACIQLVSTEITKDDTVQYHYNNVEIIEQEFVVRAHTEHFKLLEDIVPNLNRSDSIKQIYEQILNAMVTYQAENAQTAVFGIDKYLAAKALNKNPKTAVKYLSMMVSDGILIESQDESTGRQYYFLIKEEKTV